MITMCSCWQVGPIILLGHGTSLLIPVHWLWIIRKVPTLTWMIELYQFVFKFLGFSSIDNQLCLHFPPTWYHHNWNARNKTCFIIILNFLRESNCQFRYRTMNSVTVLHKIGFVYRNEWHIFTDVDIFGLSSVPSEERKRWYFSSVSL